MFRLWTQTKNPCVTVVLMILLGLCIYSQICTDLLQPQLWKSFWDQQMSFASEAELLMTTYLTVQYKWPMWSRAPWDIVSHQHKRYYLLLRSSTHLLSISRQIASFGIRFIHQQCCRPIQTTEQYTYQNTNHFMQAAALLLLLLCTQVIYNIFLYDGGSYILLWMSLLKSKQNSPGPWPRGVWDLKLALIAKC